MTLSGQFWFGASVYLSLPIFWILFNSELRSECSCHDEVAVDKIFSKLTKYFLSDTTYPRRLLSCGDGFTETKSVLTPFLFEKEHHRAICLSIITKYMKVRQKIKLETNDITFLCLNTSKYEYCSNSRELLEKMSMWLLAGGKKQSAGASSNISIPSLQFVKCYLQHHAF